MSVYQAIWDEWTSARQNFHDVRRIRVTTHAIQGTPACVPFAPDCVVLRERPRFETYRWREILVHPEDWAELRAEVHNDLTLGVQTVRQTGAGWVAEDGALPTVGDQEMRTTDFLFGIEVVT